MQITVNLLSSLKKMPTQVASPLKDSFKWVLAFSLANKTESFVFLLYVLSHTGKAFEGYFLHGKTTENPLGATKPQFSLWRCPRTARRRGCRYFLYFILGTCPSLLGNPAPAHPGVVVPYPGERGHPGARRWTQPSGSSPLAETWAG